MYVYVYAYMYMYVCVYIYMCVCVCVYADSFFISSPNNEEIKSILYSLENLLDRTVYIQNKVLNILKNAISEQHADLFNLSFTTSTFLIPLKTAKVIPIHEKNSILDFTNNHPISILSKLDKILEKLYIAD